ncbi:MAG: M23 family metallopeptidase, partial [Elusimicrobiota bacterium]
MVKKFFSYRYTLMLAPHQGGRVRSFSIGLPGIFMTVGIWAVVTSSGFYFFARGGALWSAWAEAQVYKARVKTLALEVSKMREIAVGVAYLKEDLRILLSHDGTRAQTTPQMSADERYLNAKKDTLSDLIAGKISQETLARIERERRAFSSVSRNLLNESGDLLLTRFDRTGRDQAIPSDWPTIGSLTSRYGMRASPFHLAQGNAQMSHRGVDIANIEGTPIRAAADGIVREAEWVSGFGRTVIMDHGFGF